MGHAWTPSCNGVVMMTRVRADRRTHPTAGQWTATASRLRTGLGCAATMRAHRSQAGHTISWSIPWASCGRQRDGREPVQSAHLCTRMPGSCTTLRLIRVEGTARGRLLTWAILHGRFLVRPVLCCDDHTGAGVLPRRRVAERSFAWMTHGRRFGKDDDTHDAPAPGNRLTVSHRLSVPPSHAVLAVMHAFML